MNNKENLVRMCTAIEPSLLESVQQHKRELAKRSGLRISTSSAVSALIRAGLEVKAAASHQ